MTIKGRQSLISDFTTFSALELYIPLFTLAESGCIRFYGHIVPYFCSSNI